MSGRSIVFLATPAVTTMILNVFFLVCVLMVLRDQLLFGNTFSRKNNDVNMKTVRAVIILVPILGLHFLIMPMRPERGSSLEMIYEVTKLILTI